MGEKQPIVSEEDRGAIPSGGFRVLSRDCQKLNSVWATSSLVDTLGLFLKNEEVPKQRSESKQKLSTPWRMSSFNVHDRVYGSL